MKKTGSVLVVSIAITVVIVSIGIVFAGAIEREILKLYYFDKQLTSSRLVDVAWECTLYNALQRRAFTFRTSSDLAEDKFREVLCGENYKAVELKDWSTEFRSRPFIPISNPEDERERRFSIIPIKPETKLGDVPSKRPCADVLVRITCANDGRLCTKDSFQAIIPISVIFVTGYNYCEAPKEVGGVKLDGVKGDVRSRLFINY